MVVHCKAGMARTGLMISSLLLYLKVLFPILDKCLHGYFLHCYSTMLQVAHYKSVESFLQFFPTAEESMDYYNQKRCVDGKGLVLPSQIVSLFNISKI